MVAFITMVALSVLAFVLAAVALILWLGKLFGSIILPCLLLALLSVLIAYVIYRNSLKERISALSNDLHTFSESVSALRRGYGWVLDVINCFVQKKEDN